MHLAYIDFAHPVHEIDKDPRGQANFREATVEKLRAILPDGWDVTSHTLRDLEDAERADAYYFGGCMTSCHLYESEYLSHVGRLVNDEHKPCLLACGSMQAHCFHCGSSLSMSGLCSRLEPDNWPGFMPGAIKIHRPESIRLFRPDPFWDYCGTSRLSLSEFHCHQVDSPPPGWVHLGASGSCHVEVIRRAWDYAPKLAFQSHPEHGADGNIVLGSFLKLWEQWKRAENAREQMVQLFIDTRTAPPRREVWNFSDAEECLADIRGCGEVVRIWQEDELLGFGASWIGRSEYELCLLALNRQAWGTNMGFELAKRLYARGRELGYSPDMMTAASRTDTPTIIQILKQLGFREQTRRMTTSGGDSSLHILWRGNNDLCPPIYWEADSRSALT